MILEVIVEACTGNLEPRQCRAFSNQVVDLFSFEQVPGGQLFLVILFLISEGLSSEIISPLNDIDIAELHLFRDQVKEVERPLNGFLALRVLVTQQIHFGQHRVNNGLRTFQGVAGSKGVNVYRVRRYVIAFKDAHEVLLCCGQYLIALVLYLWACGPLQELFCFSDLTLCFLQFALVFSVEVDV